MDHSTVLDLNRDPPTTFKCDQQSQKIDAGGLSIYCLSKWLITE